MVRKLLKDEKKALIQLGAKKVFLKKGYIDSTYEDISQYSNISIYEIEKIYKNKAEILSDIIRNENFNIEIKIMNDLKTNEFFIEDAIADTVVYNILNNKDYINIYSLFLKEVQNDDKLRHLYTKIKNEFINSLYSIIIDMNTMLLPANIEVFVDITNSLILGGGELGVLDNFINYKEIIKDMLMECLATRKGSVNNFVYQPKS